MVQLITIFIILFTLFANPVHGAEKPYKRSSVVKSYRTCMKEKNFAQARQVLTDAMREHPEAAADAQMYRYKLDALDALIGVENRKIYLNSKPDTVSFFNYMYELYVTGLQCDSVEQQAMAAREAEGKKAQQKLRGGVGQTLLPYRSKGNSLVADPDDEVDVSVLSVLSAYASSNYSGVTSYLTESLKDENLRPQMLEIGVKTYAALTDTTKAVQLLEQGFEAYPEVEYFYVTLVKHYNERGLYEQALQKVQRMTSLKPQQRDYWYVAGTELVLLDRYDEALQSFQQCIDIKADDAEAWASMGSIQPTWHTRTSICPSPTLPTTSRKTPSPNSIAKPATPLSSHANLMKPTPPSGSKGSAKPTSNSIAAKH